MLECRACLLRSIRAIAGDALQTTSITRSRQPLLLTPHLAPPIRRAASTAAATKNAISNDIPNEGDAFDVASRRSVANRDAKALRTELKYLSDPLKLAEHVRYTLRCNKPEKALDLCRLASKQQEVIVSWNHCIDWHMSHNKIDEAIKIYNEMKKRAQFPDSYTYILLLRGLSRLHHHGDVVKQANVVRAMSIYNSMSGPTSRVKPSIYHTNAAMKVCSAALDMDSLWSIAAKLPSAGQGAPDHMTYAILLHAIRHGAMGNTPEDSSLGQIAARRREAVNQGRRIWQEIIAKWRAGQVHIDEELVCAMGRLLLMSRRMEDWDDVFSLVQQTMNVERQIAPLGSAERHAEHVPQEVEPPSHADPAPEDADGYVDAPSERAFQPVKPLQTVSSHPDRPKTLAFVTPGNPTLSMLIGTCTELRIPKTANVYWDILTADDGPYKLHADLPNFHAYFRLLGVNRSSAKAVQVLKSMPDNKVIPKNMTFRIVMSICVRDKNNHNVLQHARAIVDEMERHCAEPDVHPLIHYLNLALNTDDGPKIVSVLDRLEPIALKLGSNGRGPAVTGTQSGKETPAFLQALVGVIDTLVHRRLVREEEFESLQTRRDRLTQFIGKAKSRADRLSAEAEINTQAREKKLQNSERDAAMVKKEHNDLRMSTPEYALRKLRWKEGKMLRKEEKRQKATRLRDWDISQSQRRHAIEERRGAQLVDRGHRAHFKLARPPKESKKLKVDEMSEFADSPMELGMR